MTATGLLDCKLCDNRIRDGNRSPLARVCKRCYDAMTETLDNIEEEARS